MNIYPKIISPMTKSGAEHFIFSLIKKCNLGEYYCAFHSLLVPSHRYKYIGETDFAILTPAGIIILEVKGGVISTVHGEWLTKDKRGNVHRLKESPLSQAKDNMYSITDKMISESLPFSEKANLKGFGVIFPDCRFDVDSADIPQELILDTKGLYEADPIGAFIRRLERYWTRRMSCELRYFTPAEFFRIQNWMRPLYYGVESIRADRIALSERMVGLLDEQMDFMEAANGKSRIICRGGAGTGKTLLGLEYARRMRENGNEAVFLVPSDIFCKYLSGRGYSYSWIIPFKKLMSQKNHSIDLIVVDESHDMMTLEYFTEIDRVLKGGIYNGQWTILIDNQNQTGVDGVYSEEWYQHLKGIADIDFLLPRNIRNTIQIIDVTQELTGRDMGKRGTGPGPEIMFVKYSDDADLHGKLLSVMKQLKERDLEPGSITLLGKGDMAANLPARILRSSGYGISELGEANAGKYPFKELAYSNIRNFKGMETYTAIVDMSEFTINEFKENMFYVAITRSVACLILLYPDSMSKDIGYMQLHNLRRKSTEQENGR